MSIISNIKLGDSYNPSKIGLRKYQKDDNILFREPGVWVINGNDVNKCRQMLIDLIPHALSKFDLIATFGTSNDVTSLDSNIASPGQSFVRQDASSLEFVMERQYNLFHSRKQNNQGCPQMFVVLYQSFSSLLKTPAVDFLMTKGREFGMNCLILSNNLSEFNQEPLECIDVIFQMNAPNPDSRERQILYDAMVGMDMQYKNRLMSYFITDVENGCLVFSKNELQWYKVDDLQEHDLSKFKRTELNLPGPPQYPSFESLLAKYKEVSQALTTKE